MNEIDLIIIVNVIAFLCIVFLCYKWYVALLKEYGKKVALLLPIALIAFVSASNAVSENDVKELAYKEVTEQLDNPRATHDNSNSKTISFSCDASLLQKLHFAYQVTPDSLNHYQVIRDAEPMASGLMANLEWTDQITNIRKLNNGNYEFSITSYYNAKILGVISYSGEKHCVKQVNINNY